MKASDKMTVMVGERERKDRENGKVAFGGTTIGNVEKRDLETAAVGGEQGAGGGQQLVRTREEDLRVQGMGSGVHARESQMCWEDGVQRVERRYGEPQRREVERERERAMGIQQAVRKNGRERRRIRGDDAGEDGKRAKGKERERERAWAESLRGRVRGLKSPREKVKGALTNKDGGMIGGR